LIQLGAKLLWKPFGIVEEAIKPRGQGGERAEVAGTEKGAHNHIMLRGEGMMANPRPVKLRGCHLRLKKKSNKLMGLIYRMIPMCL